MKTGEFLRASLFGLGLLCSAQLSRSQERNLSKELADMASANYGRLSATGGREYKFFEGQGPIFNTGPSSLRYRRFEVDRQEYDRRI